MSQADLLSTDYLARMSRGNSLQAVSWAEPFSDGTVDVHAAVIRGDAVPGPFEFGVVAQHAVIGRGLTFPEARDEAKSKARQVLEGMLQEAERLMAGVVSPTPDMRPEGEQQSLRM